MVVLDDGEECFGAGGESADSVAGMGSSFTCSSDSSMLYGHLENDNWTYPIYRQAAGSSGLTRVQIATVYT
jgi:hypothetical protein